jgi:hypothetical protein
MERRGVSVNKLRWVPLRRHHMGDETTVALALNQLPTESPEYNLFLYLNRLLSFTYGLRTIAAYTGATGVRWLLTPVTPLTPSTDRVTNYLIRK